MFHKILLSGFEPQKLLNGEIPIGQLKSQARRASHSVPGCDDQLGPVIRFDYRGQIIKRKITRRELVFGVKAPDDNSGGGFAGLVSWRESDEGSPSEVLVNLARAKMAGADKWVVQFVRDVIVAAGWTIVSPEGLTMNEAFDKAISLVQKHHPDASQARKEAFACSVVLLMTGQLFGASAGPTCREHAAGRLYQAGEKFYSFAEATELLLQKNGPIFGPISNLHRECAEQEYCFGDDPEDIAEIPALQKGSE